MNEHLRYYVVAVMHPEVSGFEHREMLLVRDRLSRLQDSLTEEEQRQLAAADRQLLDNAPAFNEQLARVTDLQLEREQRDAQPKQWWWYLDVLSQLPARPLPHLSEADVA